ncbi:hypothetical protein NBRC116583_27420 [Arenicella sp. 4NH20-0111]|uniref:hypothetical protein n=1 Tax=Arenicella sp. 4NH20-0111 TaxID=3127648 RepID=UPI003105250D
MKEIETDIKKRKLLGLATATLLAPIWSKPLINAVILPAHAQTSVAMCTTDTTVGGPLAGNASGATTCQAACEFEADAIGPDAEVCEVRETTNASGGVDCACDIDSD